VSYCSVLRCPIGCKKRAGEEATRGLLDQKRKSYIDLVLFTGCLIAKFPDNPWKNQEMQGLREENDPWCSHIRELVDIAPGKGGLRQEGHGVASVLEWLWLPNGWGGLRVAIHTPHDSRPVDLQKQTNTIGDVGAPALSSDSSPCSLERSGHPVNRVLAQLRVNRGARVFTKEMTNVWGVSTPNAASGVPCGRVAPYGSVLRRTTSHRMLPLADACTGEEEDPL